MEYNYNECPECGYTNDSRPNVCPVCGFDLASYRADLQMKQAIAFAEQQAIERAQREKKYEEAKNRLAPIRQRLKLAQGIISLCCVNDENCREIIVGLKADGTVVTAPNHRYYDVIGWTDIVAISAVDYNIWGIKKDGTVIDTGNKCKGYQIENWRDIVAVKSEDPCVVGIKKDGTLVTNEFASILRYEELMTWTDIVDIVIKCGFAVGLKADGTVITHKLDNIDVSDWEDIVAIGVYLDWRHINIFGLKADGTVVTTLKSPECDVSSWTDIVAISAGNECIAGLKADGTVVTVPEGRYDVSDWTDIVAISAGACIAGLKSDGTVVKCDRYDLPCDVPDWKLFSDFENLEEERNNARKKREEAEETAVDERIKLLEPIDLESEEDDIDWDEIEFVVKGTDDDLDEDDDDIDWDNIIMVEKR